MDEVQAKHETVVITKHGKPVAKLVPVEPQGDDWPTWLCSRMRARMEMAWLLPTSLSWSWRHSPAPVCARHGTSSGLSQGPVDRIIAATALVEGLSLLTADRQIRRSTIQFRCMLSESICISYGLDGEL